MHIGFIMDGNRRWAEKRGMLKYLGHDKGADKMEEIVDLCLKEGIEYVSIWALAKKNLERSSEELNHLFTLLRKKIISMKKKYIENGIRFETVGNLELLPTDIKEILLDLQDATKDGSKITFILAMAYGGQDEIVRGVKTYLKENIDKINPENIDSIIDNLDEKLFANYLDTGKYPPPDLIVRTGGDIRLSGYFLYQSEYSEYYFTPTFWPDFDDNEFYKALDSLKNAKRNFGK
ncbi:MAG: polyprenyl diphosphate synthase [Candidatus Gracilibacteria bacterium]|nr:polyprenyl diphosphate synthase [Candidatus Gracilibacteria bacterium]